MSSTVSLNQRIAAGLSACARVGSAMTVAPSIPAFAAANRVACAPVTGHMNTGWLGGFAETGCVHTTYVTKRNTTGSLCEVST